MDENTQSTIEATEELLIKIPSTIIHLVDDQQSVELAYGDLELILLRQNDANVVVLARIKDEQNPIQWPLTKDETSLKLDDSHYLFITLSSDGDVLNYGLRIPSKGQETLLKEFDSILEKYCVFKEERVEVEMEMEGEARDWWVVSREVGPEEMRRDAGKREKMEESAAAWMWRSTVEV